jgi:hypothetical protein
MKTCEQAENWTIYQHGMDVANRYRDLHDILTTNNIGHYKWAIPDMIQLRALAKKALSPKDARTYQVFHDCGKPFCRTVDENGRQHFPDHARISTEIYSQLFPEDIVTAELISLDMACHTLKGDEAKAFASHELAPTLCLTAWAELHSNAEKLFGGFDSDSFKIKRSRLSKLTTLIYKNQS